MNRAHVMVPSQLLDLLRSRPEAVVVSASEFDDLLHICVVESDLLPDDGGCHYLVVEGGSVRFSRDVDV